MGCSNSRSTSAVDDSKATTAATATAPAPPTTKPNKMAASPKPEYPASEAFTIPLDDAVSATVALNETLRQPPKRLQQLMQQAAETEPLTLEELADKQQKAELRRQELMQQKLENIQKNTQMLMREPNQHREQETEAAQQELKEK